MAREVDRHLVVVVNYAGYMPVATVGARDKLVSLPGTVADHPAMAGRTGAEARVPPVAWVPQSQCCPGRTATHKTHSPAAQTIPALVVMVAVLDFPQSLNSTIINGSISELGTVSLQSLYYVLLYSIVGSAYHTHHFLTTLMRQDTYTPGPL